MSQADVARSALERWEHRPDLFAQDLFGLKLWSRQAELLRTVASSKRVAVRSGHKVGKSLSVSVLALWWAVTRYQGRVILLAPTNRQIVEIVWREVRALYGRSRLPLGGEPYTQPDRGIQWSDGSQIFGFSTDAKEKVAGISGNILYILDEASGIPDEVHEVCSTNVSGSLVMISNPTRTSGAFFDAFHSRSEAWTRVHISSEEAAAENTWIERLERFRWPSLANKAWIDARASEYGTESPYYSVRVRGDFSRQSDNAVVSLDVCEKARERWRMPQPSDGQMCIGVDVARFGSDDSCIVWRRGLFAAPPVVIHGQDNVEVAGHVRQLIKLHGAGEVAKIFVDTSNGGGVADVLRHAQADDHQIETFDVQAQESSATNEYARRRDELWFCCRDWLRQGGAIPDDARLLGDLTAPLYDYDERAKIKVESKRELRKRISRSTDRADALALAVWDDPANRFGWSVG